MGIGIAILAAFSMISDLPEEQYRYTGITLPSKLKN